MQRNEYVVVYMPFENSDMTLDTLEFGVDEGEALRLFTLLHPVARVVSVTQR